VTVSKINSLTRRRLSFTVEPRTDWAAQSRPARRLRIALVNMPWARCDTPSIQCGLLKAGLAGYGHEVDVHYLNLDLAALLGADVYTGVWSLPNERQNMLGDWLFTVAAYGENQGQQLGREYLDRCGNLAGPLRDRSLTPDDLRRMREETLPGWIADKAAAIEWGRYDLIGFTSTFAQNLAALAFAQVLKRQWPQAVTVFGGANLDGEMGPEYVRTFPAINYAVSGEGDLIVPVLAARISAGRSPLGLPGVSGRGADGELVTGGQAPKVEDMDSLPEPDYEEYFATVQRLGRAAVLSEQRPVLLFETSRGCWWGEKHHCTFCGLNAQGMAYRAKSPRRVLDELAALTGRHRVLVVEAVDNIMDMKYLTSVCTELRDARWDLRMFYEVKANLSREQLRVLKDAGVTQLQPGLESLSSHVLGLMRKGSTMLTNVKLLKWSRYYNIQVMWNILTGFPGERDADYEEQIELIPSLVHLPPPSGTTTIWLERFSPYFTGEFPLLDVRPQEAYRYVYPPEVNLDRIAYFFDYRAKQVSSEPVRARLADAVAGWRGRWSQRTLPVLTYQRGPGWMSIIDTRGDKPRRVSLDKWRVSAYEYCGDKQHTAARVHEHLAAQGHDLTEQRVAAFLDQCVTERLMVGENGKYFSLALPQNENW
jgi:ribosomal peptide maturation radical SAM protein 1